MLVHVSTRHWFSLTLSHILPGASWRVGWGLGVLSLRPSTSDSCASNGTQAGVILRNLLTTAENPFTNYYQDFQYSISDALVLLCMNRSLHSTSFWIAFHYSLLM